MIELDFLFVIKRNVALSPLTLFINCSVNYCLKCLLLVTVGIVKYFTLLQKIFFYLKLMLFF